MIKIIDGKEVSVHEIEPVLTKEQFNEYQLPNGDLLKIKVVMTALYQSDVKDNKGNWEYSFDIQPVIRIIQG